MSIVLAQANDGVLPQSSPAFLSDVPKPTGVVDAVPTKPYPTGSLDMHWKLDLSKYPAVKQVPPTDSPEVKNAIAAIDWTKVPKAPIRKKLPNGSLDVSNYNIDQDPDCWWSASICKTPKATYLPSDYYMCPTVGDWGLNYDDGPLNPVNFDHPDSWAEPALYDFLTDQNHTATLFYIGSYVVSFPSAAQRALNSGNVLCSHTWSHKQMTSLTNEQLVAEFYWSLRAIKEATGVTTKCWRPPFGDVDDRVRAIAHQMGMRTFLWEQDSFDWQIGSSHPSSEVDGYFEKWLADRNTSADSTNGHITLQHELNADTIKTAMKWLPQVSKKFNVMPIHQCLDDTSPYWESNFVYPKRDGSVPETKQQVDSSKPSAASRESASGSASTQQASSSSSSMHATLLPFVAATAMFIYSTYF
ncbi:hypothetical protein K450DRAFT_173211 [Umbelopsis ramanniana AG]|uniref:NodB homology domain-containing protein n=1 Tax=Umbelopsis ramanniana AG TaxID=1314678 RepID=A0AAD5HDY4_UMBRA|nr:uncharacterized protein K450DRAFT_173211 [Umbelopsis ramanniana AG]KAI8580697.1 hypothetical protein K450DRAFT_173211 [Umbelopsis ramanniana AG]